MADDFTARFRVDISDLKKNITEANKQIKLANATFKAETAGMEDWTKNADGLSSKLRSLKTVLESQKSILSSYQSQLERQQKAYEENGARVDKLKEKLRELSANGVSKADDEYKKYEAALRSAMKEQENNGKAVDDLKLKILNQQAAIGKTESSIRKYTTAEQNLGNESEEAASDIKKMDKSLDQVSGSAGRAKDKLAAIGKTLAKGLATGIATVGAAATAGVAALAKATSNAGKYADEINTLSKVTGMSSESLQAYKYAAELVDVSMETLTGSMSKNVKSMSNAANGSAKYADAYKKLGVAVTDSNGELRNSEDVYWETIDALGNIQNETERDAIAMQLFGKSARDLNPLIETGSKGIADLTKEAKEMGAVMSQESLDKLNALDDTMQRLKGGAAAAKNAIGTILLPELQTLADDGVSLISSFTKEINAANGDWNKIGDAVGNLAEKFSDKILDYLPKLVEVGGKIVSGLGSAIVKAAPKLAKTATTVLTTLTTNLIKSAPSVLKSGSEVIKNFITGLKSALPDILTAIKDSLPDILNTIVDLGVFLAENAGDIIVPIVEAIPSLITEFVTTLTSKENTQKVIDGAVTLVNSLVDSIPDVLTAITDAIPTILDSIFGEDGFLSADNITKLVDCAADVVGKLVESIPKVISALVSAIPTVLNSIFGEKGFLSASNISKLISGASDIVLKLVGEIPTIISSFVEAIPTIISSLFGENGFLSGKNISKLVSSAAEVVIKLVGEIPTIVSALVGAIPDIIDELFDPDSGFLSDNNINDLVSGAVAVVGEIVKNIPKIIQSLLDAIPGVIDSIVGSFSKIVSKFLGLGEEAAEAFKNGFKGAISGIVPGGQLFVNGQLEANIPEADRKGFADGGVVTRRTKAILGDAGPEVVIPLRNNASWVSKVASQLAHNLSTPQTMSAGTFSSNRNIQFVQNNYSPKPLSRIEIYRQSRNLLSLYGGNV